MDEGARELLFVLLVMGVLLLFGIVAVAIFIRTWRKERKAAAERTPPPREPH